MDAVKANRQFAREIGWLWVLAQLATLKDLEPDLAALAQAFVQAKKDPGHANVLGAIRSYQERRGLKPDAIMGPTTWRDVARRFPRPDNAVLVAGVYLQVKAPGVAVRQHDSGGLPRLRSRGGCDDRQFLVIHWGGLHAEHCHATLQERGLSSHLLVQGVLDGEGKLIVNQCVDLCDTALHAGDWNGRSIGLDVCRSPRVQFAKRYSHPEFRDNTTGRGEPKFVALPGEVGARIRPFIAEIARIFDLPYTYPGHQVLKRPEGHRGVVGHHNLSANKWDVAVWSDELWEGV